jgi:hypothetical protein
MLREKLRQHEKTNPREYVQVLDIPNTSPQKIYKRILNNCIPKYDVIQSKVEKEKIIIRYDYTVGPFK